MTGLAAVVGLLTVTGLAGEVATGLGTLTGLLAGEAIEPAVVGAGEAAVVGAGVATVVGSAVGVGGRVKAGTPGELPTL